jgi:hypothetical protein
MVKRKATHMKKKTGRVEEHLKGVRRIINLSGQEAPETL